MDNKVKKKNINKYYENDEEERIHSPIMCVLC